MERPARQTESCTENDIAHYNCKKINSTLQIDGDLNKPAWQNATRSNRFVDMVTGEPAIFNTQAAALWNDENLYIAFWPKNLLLRLHKNSGTLLCF